jgi:hypothetical protein
MDRSNGARGVIPLCLGGLLGGDMGPFRGPGNNPLSLTGNTISKIALLPHNSELR